METNVLERIENVNLFSSFAGEEGSKEKRNQIAWG